MDEKLKDELRVYNLLPASLDDIAQEKCEQMGIDTSKLETHYSPNASHYSPNTRPDILRKKISITENVILLHEMEFHNKANSTEYSGIVKQIREDLDYLNSHCFNGGIALATGDTSNVGIVNTNPEMPFANRNNDLSSYSKYFKETFSQN